MKRQGNLWSQVFAWDNLLLAAKKARRGKKDRPTVTLFEWEREKQLLRLQVSGFYRLRLIIAQARQGIPLVEKTACSSALIQK
jgi:hypothetical protein